MGRQEDLPIIEIGLLWHSSRSGNLGVGALTIANIAIARSVVAELDLQPRFLIIGMADSHPSYLTRPDIAEYSLYLRTLLDPSGFWRLLKRVDCLLDIGAGDSFADIYSERRFAFLWLTKMMAIMRRKPLLLSPQTIGPFTRSPHKQLAGLALRGATAVVVRDRMSLDALYELAPAADGLLAVDVAFALPYQDNRHLRGSQKLRVGVNVSGMLFNESEAGNNRFGIEVDYALLMRSFLATLVARPNVEVHLIAHVNEAKGAWDGDGDVADRLAVEFPGVIRVTDFVGPCEAKSYISGMDVLIAGRMHACIAAFSSGVPVVPVSYSRKFSGLFGLLDYEWMIPATGMPTDAALVYLTNCLENLDEMSRDITAGLAKVEILLEGYRERLRRLFSAAAAAK